MSRLNWSMTALGYPAHTRSGGPVVGISHMSTFAAMRFAEEIGVRTGWLLTEGASPQIELVKRGAATAVSLRDLMNEQRVARTEGMSAGSLVFAAGAAGGPRPPTDRPLREWAETQHQPWVEIVDNEVAYWGGLDKDQTTRLIAWFCCQRPLEIDWRQVRIHARTLARLTGGLFEHGWSRNLDLVRADRRTVDLWGGVHQACLLEHAARAVPSQIQAGLRLRLALGEFEADELDDACPLSDETGRAVTRSGLWGG